jgi:hypothetical protein
MEVKGPATTFRAATEGLNRIMGCLAVTEPAAHRSRPTAEEVAFAFQLRKRGRAARAERGPAGA